MAVDALAGTASPPDADRRQDFVPLLLIGLVFCIYLNSLGEVFLFDDNAVIAEYSPVHSFAGWFAGLSGGIRPALKFSYMLNWISGAGPMGFHALNIGIHAANTVLVYRLAAALTGRFNLPGMVTGWKSPAFLTALLFAVHPVQTEAVAYISGRSSSLMAFFYLAALLAYIRGTEIKQRLWIYIYSPLLFLTAAATKETALTLPLAMVLWDATDRSGQGRCGAVLKRQAAHWLLAVLVVLLVLTNPRYGRLLWFSLDIRNLHDNLLSQINGISYLLSRLVFVAGLNIDPDIRTVGSWTPFLVLEFMLLSGMLALAVLNRRKRPWISFGVAWFFVILLPTNSVIPRLDIANERQMYLAVPGIFFSLSAELSLAKIYERKAAVAAVAVIFVLLASFTVLRNNVYRSEVSLWEDTARKSPGKSRVFNNLGCAYEDEGGREKALAMYERALQLDPDNAVAKDNKLRIEAVEKYKRQDSFLRPYGRRQ